MLSAADAFTDAAEGPMGNVNMPTPVALAGGALCLLGGYLVGAVAGPDTASRTTAEVVSYESGTSELCLRGGGVEGQLGTEDGLLCGIWRHSDRDTVPEEGDSFRFVSIVSSRGSNSVTYIYGSVTD